MRLQQLEVVIGEISAEAPGCRSIRYNVSLIDDRGAEIQSEQQSLVNECILDDPEQIPWLIAHTLHAQLQDLVKTMV
jgi:hypothetical protein